jgi:indolepyruvate ferredoxin oxidoreductase beta subunit
MMNKNVRIYITGVGGQGTLLATKLIGQAAGIAGANANLSEIHGMAQRGGIVESSVTLGDLKSPMISEGQADVLLSFEPVETLRSAKRCNSESVVITNTAPVQPFTVTTGSQTYPETSAALEKMKSRVGKMVIVEATRLAKEAGTIMSLNVVMLGALCKHADMPFSVDHMQEAIKTNMKPKLVETNIKALELGYAS